MNFYDRELMVEKKLASLERELRDCQAEIGFAKATLRQRFGANGTLEVL